MAHVTAEAKLGAKVLGTPTPRVFYKKRLDLLDCKGVTFLETTKRLQADGNKGDRGSKGGVLSEVCSEITQATLPYMRYVCQ